MGSQSQPPVSGTLPSNKLTPLTLTVTLPPNIKFSVVLVKFQNNSKKKCSSVTTNWTNPIQFFQKKNYECPRVSRHFSRNCNSGIGILLGLHWQCWKVEHRLLLSKFQRWRWRRCFLLRNRTSQILLHFDATRFCPSGTGGKCHSVDWSDGWGGHLPPVDHHHDVRLLSLVFVL